MKNDNCNITQPASSYRSRAFTARVRSLVGTMLLVGSLVVPALADSPGPQNAPRQDPLLALLQNIYWRAFYGEITLPTDHNGNAAIGDLVFMALPNAPGDGTPGVTNITLKAGESFFLPLWNLLGNSYQDGSSDPVFDLKIFRTLDFKLTLDGVTLIDGRNLMEHYFQFPFVPPIPYDVPPATAFIRLQGTSVLHGPLSPGKHVLHLDAKNTDTADLFGLTFEYHNTWNLTVKPGR
jgi:hypothetical protein